MALARMCLRNLKRVSRNFIILVVVANLISALWMWLGDGTDGGSLRQGQV